MILATLGIFSIFCAAVVLIWNRAFFRVPLRIVGLFFAICVAYQSSTLFTQNVDVPGSLAFVTYPWKALGRSTAPSNTGIVFTQIAPWTRIARDDLLHWELPLWNRTAGGGKPLLANQQTAIFHPFTLAGLPLSLGKSFTLTATLRLFALLFFTFVLLRQWDMSDAASCFGAVAFTFCTFHIVWLLFPLGLSTMMLPACLSGAFEVVRRPSAAAYLLLTFALVFAVLGGHPESALWVWITTAAYVLYVSATATNVSLRLRSRRAVVTTSAFLVAGLLSAFWWLPTLRALTVAERFQQMQATKNNPANHGLSAEWLLPFITPNILGNPVEGTYTPPRGSHPAILNDYGEVASSYAGLITLAFALAAPVLVRQRRPTTFALALMVFAFLTVSEAPIWRDLIRAIPLVGVSILQRLRILWDLGVCIGAAIVVDDLVIQGPKRVHRVSLIAVACGAALIYAIRSPAFLSNPLAIARVAVPLATVVLMLVFLHTRANVFLATVLVFADLVIATYRYNPPASPEDVYPTTGAIAWLQRQPAPFRIVAGGWSFLPETPGYYGLEDVKATDPIEHAGYMRLLRGYLRIDPSSYDLVVRDFSQPFFDSLNIRYLYAPPHSEIPDVRFVERYRGADGAVFENTHVLPRYFFVHRFEVEPDFGRVVWRSRAIRDYRELALIDRVPSRVQSANTLRRGNVRLVSYTSNETQLDIESDGWNLLVSSDVAWPGWRAYWNGARQPTVTANGAFVGCFVPPGRGRLVLRYRPDEFERGRRLGLAGLIALAVAFAAFRRSTAITSSSTGIVRVRGSSG